jgi:hypothetical protein
MSDTPQGPGWWLASDGKYYPPEQASQPKPPPPVPAPPAPGPDAVGAPPAPKKSGGKGCLYAVIAVAVIAFIGIVGVVVAVVFVGGKAVDTLEDAAQQKPCPFLSDSEASSALGRNVDAVELSGFTGFVGIGLDTRVLENAPDCVLLADNDEAAARVARYQGSDAGSKFAQEKDAADGTSKDQGGGISIETDAYLGDQEVTVGDEGFCTTSSLLGSSGALVRKGDTLVYVSIQPPIGSTGTVPDLDLDAGGFTTDADKCTTAQQIALKVFG